MKRLTPLLTSLVFVFACTPSDEEDGETNADDVGDTGDADTGDGDGDTGDGDGDTTTDTGTEPVATITGTVLGMDGEPLPSPGIQWCGPIDEEGNVDLCIPVTVGDGGTFEIGSPNPGLWNFKAVHGPADGRFFTGQAVQIVVVEGEDQDWADPIVVPEVGALSAVVEGEQLVDIDGTLGITLDPANALTPDFTPPTELGGLEVSSEFWEVTEIDGSPVLAAWSFSPFGVKASTGSFGITIENAGGLNPALEADAMVVLYEIKKDNAEIHEVGVGTVNADATAIDVVASGEGLHELTWLMIVAQ